MKIDQYGIVELNSEDGLDLLYKGILDFTDFQFDQETANYFNSSKDKNNDPFEKIKKYKNLNKNLQEFDQENQNIWFMPTNYCPNLIEWIYSQCSTDIQIKRVNVELELYMKHNMLDVLFFLKYLVDVMRKNDIVWGVGRGSSVSSYVLFLIGVHKIDSIEYDLDINEFFK